MDDILISHPNRAHLQTILQDLTQALSVRGLKIDLEKSSNQSIHNLFRKGYKFGNNDSCPTTIKKGPSCYFE